MTTKIRTPKLKVQQCEFCGGLGMYRLAGTLCRPGETEVYEACPMCLMQLVTHALTPEQYMRSLRAGGDMDRYHVHDDFYDPADGTAFQPVMGVPFACTWGAFAPPPAFVPPPPPGRPFNSKTDAEFVADRRRSR